MHFTCILGINLRFTLTVWPCLISKWNLNHACICMKETNNSWDIWRPRCGLEPKLEVLGLRMWFCELCIGPDLNLDACVFKNPWVFLSAEESSGRCMVRGHVSLLAVYDSCWEYQLYCHWYILILPIIDSFLRISSVFMSTLCHSLQCMFKWEAVMATCLPSHGPDYQWVWLDRLVSVTIVWMSFGLELPAFLWF